MTTGSSGSAQRASARRPGSSKNDPAVSAPNRVAVGRINGVWGMRGFVKVLPLTSNPARLQAGSEVLLLGRPARIAEVVTPQGYPIIRFEGYPDRTAAERLRDTLIEIDERDLAPLAEDEHYIDDLVGLDVVTNAGDLVGRLAEVLATGANDVYVVTREGQRDALIPAIASVVLSVDLEARKIVVDPVPGLLD